MMLKMLSEWHKTLHALLLESFAVVNAVPYLWGYSCSVTPAMPFRCRDRLLGPSWELQ